MLQNRKVDLFIVGAPKCGTTAWVDYLSSHPHIHFCRQKEPHYFCEDFPNFTWAQSLDEYHNLFDDVAKQIKVVGEASIMYLYSKIAAEKIHIYNPDAKILIFLRSYVDFLKSYHRQLLNLLDEDEPAFEKAWFKQRERSRGVGVPQECREPSFLQYRDVASFGCQMERYFRMFPRDQVKVIGFEQWTKSPRETYLEILGFLNLSDDGRQLFERINMAKVQRSRSIARLTRRPPQLLMDVVEIFKKIAGVKRLNLAKRLKSFNEKTCLVEDITDELKLQILEELKSDALLVAKYVDYNPSEIS